jgi:RimJ/RimL family protein N-acetyltransferase
MLTGPSVQLRLVREADLGVLYAHHLHLANRGDFYPQGVRSEPEYRRRFQETGFWGDDRGLLVIVDRADGILGHVQFFRTVNYLDEIEVAYHVYDPAQRGKGVATEAVGLMVRHLFELKPVNRIRLVIHPGNLASRRVAEKCGFTHEGTARGALFLRGRHHDVEIHSILRRDVLGSSAAEVGTDAPRYMP